MVSANIKPLSEFKTGEFVQIEKIQLEGNYETTFIRFRIYPWGNN